MSILCLIGAHKWSKKKEFIHYNTDNSDFAMYCEKCHKKKIWKDKRTYKEDEEDEENY